VVVVNEIGPKEWTLFFIVQGKSVLVFSYFYLIRCGILYVKGMLYILFTYLLEIQFICVMTLVQIYSYILALRGGAVERLKFQAERLSSFSIACEEVADIVFFLIFLVHKSNDYVVYFG